MSYPPSSAVLNSGRSYGVLGIAGNTTSGYNYGVVGILNGAQNGTGVFGGLAHPQYMDGRYAGYFEGNVKVTGLLNGITVGSSDVRYKKDIIDLNPEKSLKSILMMRPVEYRMEQQYVETATKDSISNNRYPVYDEKSPMFQKKHYGLIAQELQELYPDLVYEVNDNGYLGINYMEIIPMLIQSVQELNRKIEVLESAGIGLRGSAEIMGLSSISETTGKAVLFQNAPNPFSVNTEIKYFLPAGIANANLFIYDMQGKQIKNIPVIARGEGSVQIQGADLSAGMYFYTLVVDNKVVDTKRMILTE